jgi:hypothetical protein
VKWDLVAVRPVRHIAAAKKGSELLYDGIRQEHLEVVIMSSLPCLSL